MHRWSQPHSHLSKHIGGSLSPFHFGEECMIAKELTSNLSAAAPSRQEALQWGFGKTLPITGSCPVWNPANGPPWLLCVILIIIVIIVIHYTRCDGWLRLDHRAGYCLGRYILGCSQCQLQYNYEQNSMQIWAKPNTNAINALQIWAKSDANMSKTVERRANSGLHAGRQLFPSHTTSTPCVDI